MSEYRIMLQQEPDGSWRGRCYEFPGITHKAATPADCELKMRDAISMAVQDIVDSGGTPPPPGSRSANRDVQVNIRLSEHERDTMLAALARSGFASLSDYLRTAGLEKAQGVFGT